MTHKVILLADPGIDTAFAISLALWDPRIEVLGLLAVPGNVQPEQATQNVHLLIDQCDPPRWPRLGAAFGPAYEIDGTQLHGPDGLGGAGITEGSLHSPTPSDKLLSELVHQAPKEVTVGSAGASKPVRDYTYDAGKKTVSVIAPYEKGGQVVAVAF